MRLTAGKITLNKAQYSCQIRHSRERVVTTRAVLAPFPGAEKAKSTTDELKGLALVTGMSYTIR